jgi:hypothetical protein
MIQLALVLLAATLAAGTACAQSGDEVINKADIKPE